MLYGGTYHCKTLFMNRVAPLQRTPHETNTVCCQWHHQRTCSLGESTGRARRGPMAALLRVRAWGDPTLLSADFTVQVSPSGEDCTKTPLSGLCELERSAD